VYWTVKAACECKYIDKVFVATDSNQIKMTLENFYNGKLNDLFSKMEIIERSNESASDNASTEFAMMEFANRYEFDNIVLIQATSPLLEREDLEKGFEVFAEEDTDSVISVVIQKRFNWEKDEKGYAYPTNYDVFCRPRRQEFSGYMVENGAFYITSKKNLIKSGNRISGKIKAVIMNPDSYFEIDEPEDWYIIENLMKKRKKDFRLNPLIKMFLTDCDGCLTDGGMYYSEKGDELKKFNTRDGMGFSMLKQKGIITGIITSEDVDLNKRRAEKMEVDELVQGCKDKRHEVLDLCSKYGIGIENVAYIGDDINDLGVIKMVGLSCCPSDAMPGVRATVRYVAKAKGGEGVIREVADMILACDNEF
jgi:N-acylneuraminate cytidylyltransferase